MSARSELSRIRLRWTRRRVALEFIYRLHKRQLDDALLTSLLARMKKDIDSRFHPSLAGAEYAGAIKQFLFLIQIYAAAICPLLDAMDQPPAHREKAGRHRPAGLRNPDATSGERFGEVRIVRPPGGRRDRAPQQDRVLNLREGGHRGVAVHGLDHHLGGDERSLVAENRQLGERAPRTSEAEATKGQIPVPIPSQNQAPTRGEIRGEIQAETQAAITSPR
jgi:hypothetical protein